MALPVGLAACFAAHSEGPASQVEAGEAAEVVAGSAPVAGSPKAAGPVGGSTAHAGRAATPDAATSGGTMSVEPVAGLSAAGAPVAGEPTSGTSALECVGNEQSTEVCPPSSRVCGAVATCRADGTFGPCVCSEYGQDPTMAPDAAQTAACLVDAQRVFAQPCAQCMCSHSTQCTGAVERCDGECWALLDCFRPCVPPGDDVPDVDCVSACMERHPMGTSRLLEQHFRECVEQCPDGCATPLRPVTEESDGGTADF